MRRTRLPSLAAVAMIAVCACSRTDSAKRAADRPAGVPASVGTGGAGANLKSDPEYVRDMALKNMAEIELSRLALAKTQSADVRAFAQSMVDEHAASQDALKTLVAGQSIEWPAQLDEKHQKIAEELGAKQGVEFDREYMEAMVDGHQDLAAKLESRLDVQSLSDWKTAAAARAQSNALPDPKVAMRDVAVRPASGGDGLTMKVNRWAADTYPVAQKHLDSARTLENAVKKRPTH